MVSTKPDTVRCSEPLAITLKVACCKIKLAKSTKGSLVATWRVNINNSDIASSCVNLYTEKVSSESSPILHVK